MVDAAKQDAILSTKILHLNTAQGAYKKSGILKQFRDTRITTLQSLILILTSFSARSKSLYESVMYRSNVLRSADFFIYRSVADFHTR